MGSIKKWYVPLWSELYRVRTASDQYEKPVSKLTPKDLDRSACLIFDNTNHVSAFGAKHKYDIDGSDTGLKFKAPWSGGRVA